MGAVDLLSLKQAIWLPGRGTLRQRDSSPPVGMSEPSVMLYRCYAQTSAS